MAASVTQLQSAAVETARKRLNDVLSYLKQRFVERDDVIDGLGLALVGRFNVFIGGPPGTAKSKLARALVSCIEGGRVFVTQGHRQMDMAELLGPFSPKQLREQDQFVRNIEGYLPTATVAMVDEVDKMSDAAKNGLLSALNEREIYQAGRAVPIPTRVIIGTSNANITDPNLRPFMDRFHLTYWVHPVRDVNNFCRLISSAVDQQFQTESAPQISIGDLEILEQQAKTIPVQPETLECLVRLRSKLQQLEREISDRRWVQIVQAAQIHVVLQGGDTVRPYHLRAAKAMLVQRDNDPVPDQAIEGIVPRSPLDATTVTGLEQELNEALAIQNPAKRTQALRALSTKVSNFSQACNDERLVQLRVRIIHQLNQTLSVR